MNRIRFWGTLDVLFALQGYHIMTTPILVWHRRDLRVHDNMALHDAVQRGGDVIPVFIIDPRILSRPDTAAARVSFMVNSLQTLQDRYTQLGGSFIVRQGDPVEVLPQLCRESGAETVMWNQDVEPYAIERDRHVEEALKADGVAVVTHQDMLLHGHGEILTQGGDIYSVYTPFWRNWITHTKPLPLPAPNHLHGPKLESIGIPSVKELGFSVIQDLPLAGEAAALEVLGQFCFDGSVFAYDEHRNTPAISGTSALSPHLRWGTVGIRQVWQTTVDVEPDIRSDEAEASLTTWRQELAWREFYKHVLAEWPQLETSAYRSEFNTFEWDNNLDLFAAWCEGSTGYPMVDAAMRQLNQTGWMHNRCRMIVASFLTKDLLIDWRWGEQYFMQQLVDGDLSANNGGWQWSASVGTDPKPLRIFNPATQAAKFDPEGEYIRRYVPELSGLETPALLQVGESKGAQRALRERQEVGYPDPIVNHKQQQQTYKQRYQACRLN